MGVAAAPVRLDDNDYVLSTGTHPRGSVRALDGVISALAPEGDAHLRTRAAIRSGMLCAIEVVSVGESYVANPYRLFVDAYATASPALTFPERRGPPLPVPGRHGFPAPDKFHRCRIRAPRDSEGGAD